MEITEDQYARIAPYLPVQRGNVSLSNLTTWDEAERKRRILD